jgi:hypothetical protein
MQITTTMNRHLRTIFAAGLMLIAGTLTAQEKDNDYTNNRSKGKDKQPRQVNTEAKTPVKIIQFIPGTWDIVNVYQGEKEVGKTDSLAYDQLTLEFNREGRFMKYSANDMIDSGAYRLNEDHAFLYLESEVDKKNTQYAVWFKNDTMTLQQIGLPVNEVPLKYIYRRSSNTTTSNRK